MRSSEQDLLEAIEKKRSARDAIDKEIQSLRKSLQAVCVHKKRYHQIAGDGKYCEKCNAEFGSDDD